MWKKLGLAILVAVAGVAVGTYIATGTWPFTVWLQQIQNIPTTLTNLWNQAQTYGISPIQALGAVGSVGTIATLAITKLKQKITAQAEQAKAELEATKTAALESQGQLKADYERLETRFNTETQRVQELQDKLKNVVSKEEYEKMQQQLQREFQILRQATDPTYVRACEETLKAHNLPLPKREGNVIVRTEVK